MQLRLRLQHGEAFGVASNRPELIEGAHATEMMYAFDEAKSIGPSTWDAAEGAFSAGGADAELRAFALATSTPGEPNGRFYDIHHRAQGYEDWTPRHVTLEESIAAGRIAERWAELRQAQWGVDSAIYQNRVLGEFATSDADAIIPLAWVEAAQQRWLDWWAVHKKAFPPLEQIGADIGRGGNDSAFAKRIGHVIAEVEHSKVPDTMEIAGRIKALLETAPAVSRRSTSTAWAPGSTTACWSRSSRSTPSTRAARAPSPTRVGRWALSTAGPKSGGACGRC
jgi:hypothetical protein